MRLFVAIPMTHHMKQSLQGIQKEMNRKGYKGSYTRKENLHMTAAFVGEFDRPERILEAMNRVPIPSITLELSRLGHFGDLYWVGTKKVPCLEEYVFRLRKQFHEYKIPFDAHPFLAHITVARRIIAPQNTEINVPETHMELRHVCLMESARDADGKVFYRELGRVSRGIMKEL